MREIEGGCLCGSVRYFVPDDFQYSGYCHCSECRRFSGSSFSVFGGITKEQFTIKQGEGEISRYKKTEKSIMHFCKKCGSSLYVDKPITNMIHLRWGTLDEAPSLKPQAHVCVGSKAAWDEINDQLPQFTELPESA